MDVAFITDAPLTLTDSETGQPPTSRIQVAEIGRYQDPGRYGSFSITAEEVTNWQRVLAEHFNGEVPIDLDHHTDKGISSEAAGWIKSLLVEGKRVFADVEWTPLGAKAIVERRYKFISPTFVSEWRDQVGKKLGPALLRAALTNSPFLSSMPAVSLSTAPIFAERADEVTLDAPVPIGTGDRVAQSSLDLSLGKTGTVIRVHVQEIELEADGPKVGVYVHDVVWDDGTRSDAARDHDLRCLTPYRSLAAADPVIPAVVEPDAEQMRAAFQTLAQLLPRT